MTMSSSGIYAYAASKIHSWLVENDLDHGPHSSRIDGPYRILDHGLRIHFPNPRPPPTSSTFHFENVYMSIQTHPLISGTCFAESCIQNDHRIVTGLGEVDVCFDDVSRHPEPEDLFRHIRHVVSILQDPKTYRRVA